MTILSIFGGGLWFIPSVLFIGTAYSLYKYFVTKSKGALVYAAMLAAATVGTILLMINDR